MFLCWGKQVFWSNKWLSFMASQGKQHEWHLRNLCILLHLKEQQGAWNEVTDTDVAVSMLVVSAVPLQPIVSSEQQAVCLQTHSWMAVKPACIMFSTDSMECRDNNPPFVTICTHVQCASILSL